MTGRARKIRWGIGALFAVASIWAAASLPNWWSRWAANAEIPYLLFRSKTGDKQDLVADWMLAGRQFQLGLDRFAIRSLTRAAEGGLVSAQFDLGVIYLNGKRAKRDPALGAAWLEKAALNGHPQALLDLIHLPLKENGDVLGSIDLCRLVRQTLPHSRGRGAIEQARFLLSYEACFPADAPLAFEVYHREAQDQNEPRFQAMVGIMKWGGIGTAKDAAEGMVWLTQAADQGYPPAMMLLADVYLHRRNIEPARALYRRLAQGKALRARSLVYALDSRERNPDGMSRLFQQCASEAETNKSAQALALLGTYYAMGWGTPVNPVDANRCYAAAAQLGSATGVRLEAIFLEQQNPNDESLPTLYRKILVHQLREGPLDD